MNEIILKFIAIVAVVAAIAFGIEWIHHTGYVAGVNAQKVTDQSKFDQYEQERVDQATLAANMFQSKQQEIIAKQHELDEFKTKLGEEHATRVETTNKLFAMYSAYGLRFRTTESATDRQSGGGTGCTAGNAACHESTSVVQLPAALASNLRQLALDADRLNDEYKTCYDYTHRKPKEQ